MKIKIGFLAILASLTIFSISCSKSDNPAPQKTKTELLSTTGTWKFSSASANGTDVSAMNPPFSPCAKDNILSFSAGGTGNINEGATKCDPADPTDRPFTWNWLNSETTLHISTPLFTGGSSDFNLKSLTSTQLVLEQLYSPLAGPSIIINVTFVH